MNANRPRRVLWIAVGGGLIAALVALIAVLIAGVRQGELPPTVFAIFVGAMLVALVWMWFVGSPNRRPARAQERQPGVDRSTLCSIRTPAKEPTWLPGWGAVAPVAEGLEVFSGTLRPRRSALIRWSDVESIQRGESEFPRVSPCVEVRVAKESRTMTAWFVPVGSGPLAFADLDRIPTLIDEWTAAQACGRQPRTS